MKFTNVSASNFMSYRDLNFNLQNQGLLLVLGQNQDEDASSSNGSGKTAIIDAFTFALWGQTLRGLTSDEVVNRGIGKDCFARVSFTDDDGVEYSVVRYRKHKRFQNELHLITGSEVDLSGSSIVDTQKKIDAIIGLDFETAVQSLVLGQGMMIQFSNATDADRKHVLDLILGLQSLEKCLEEVRKQKRQLDKDISTDTREIEIVENQIHRTAEEVASLKERIVTFEAKRKASVSELERKLQAINEESDNMLQTQEDTVTSKKSEIGRIDTELTKLQLQLPKREVLRQSILRMNEEEIQLRGNLETIDMQIGSEQERIEYLENTEGATCPLCEKSLSEEEKTKLINNINTSIADLRKQSGMRSAEIVKLRDERRQLSDREETFRQIDSRVAQLNLMKVQAQNAIDLSRKDDEKRGQMSARYRDLQMQLTQAREEKPDYEDLVYTKQDELTALESREKDIQGKNEANKAKLPYLQFWERGFSNQGLKSFILDNVTPILEQASNRFGKIMLGDEYRISISTQSTLKSGEAREKISIQVFNGVGEDIFNGASAGERQRINLCLSLALQELIASRHRRALGIAFFDEVTTNLDTEGMERFIELLKQELGHKDSVFVISHNPELQMYFDNIIFVTKKNGISKIEGEEK